MNKINGYPFAYIVQNQLVSFGSFSKLMRIKTFNSQKWFLTLGGRLFYESERIVTGTYAIIYQCVLLRLKQIQKKKMINHLENNISNILSTLLVLLLTHLPETVRAALICLDCERAGGCE